MLDTSIYTYWHQPKLAKSVSGSWTTHVSAFDHCKPHKVTWAAYSACRKQQISPACVAVEQAEAHASVALHTVEEIHPQTLAPPTHIAERTVIDVPARFIIKEMTYATVVAAHAAAAGAAVGCYWLPGVAEHADHLLHSVPI